MFGFFDKKSNKAKSSEFVEELSRAGSAFQDSMMVFDSDHMLQLKTRALDTYFANNPAFKNHKPADFLLEVFVQDFVGYVESEAVPSEDCMILNCRLEDFVHDNPQYATDIAINAMRCFKRELTRLGKIPSNLPSGKRVF
jgi:hypothetical protein